MIATSPGAGRQRSLVPLLDKLRYQPCPSRLMGCASTPSVVAMEIFEEPEIIAEVFVILQSGVIAEDWSASGGILSKDADQAVGKICGNFLQRQQISGAGGMLDFEIISIVMMEPLQ